jgi:hypothetical protein
MIRADTGKRSAMGNWNRTDPLIAAMGRKGEASERRHANDEELRFRVEARRDRLLAEWAASLMGLPAERVADYVAEVIDADLARPGPEDVLEKVGADLRAAGVTIDESELRARLGELEREAWRHVESASVS